MKKYTSILFCSFLSIILCFSVMKSKAQDPVNLVFLKSIPQANKVNPGSEVPYNWWIGLPVLSSTYIGFESSGFRYKDIIYRSADDSLHVDVDGFLNKLNKKNTLSIEMQTELLAFGFHARKYYVDFRLSKRTSTYINYSKDLMGFLLKGNGQYINQDASFSGTGLNASLFNEVSVGVSRPINENLYVGLRMKFISGIFNVYSKKTNISLFTDEAQAYELTLRSDIEINTSVPNSIEDPNNYINFSTNQKSVLTDLSKINNPGYGIDAGAQYTFNEKFNAGISVTDLGFITWTSNTKNYVSNKEQNSFSFRGINLYEFFANDSISFSKQLNKVLDSLKDELGIITKYESYTSPLLTRINFTGEYNLTSKDHFGALLRMDLLNIDVKPLLCLHYNHEFGRWAQLMIGYSCSENNYLNIGLGYSVKLGPCEVYMMSDNAYAVFEPTNFKSTNLIFGMNLCFGDRRE